MVDYKQKLGIGYLEKAGLLKGADVAPPAKHDFLAEAVMLYGRLILQVLKDSPQGARVHDIVKTQRIDISDALQVIKDLGSRDLAHVDQVDELGNHLVSITAQGRKSLARGGAG